MGGAAPNPILKAQPDFMKTKHHSTFDIRHLAFILQAAFTLFTTAPRAAAQDDTVTISAAEFQRLVYSGHVLTEIAHKPELDAVLQTLLEVQRRNPQADPVELAGVLQQALERFRTNAPVYLRSTEARDEILAVYLEAFHQVPAHTNFSAATLPLLDILMGRPGQNPPTNVSPATLLHASNQGFIYAEDRLAERQALVDACTRRARDNALFRQALDQLMGAESGVLFGHSPERIITNNPALSGNPALRALLTLSQTAPDGGVQISMAGIVALLTNEMQILRGTIETNRQVHLDILQHQGDLTAYLADTNLVEAMARYEAECKEPQANLIVASHASANTLSELMKTRDVTRSRYFRALQNAWTSISDASFNWRLNSKFAAINKWNTALKFGKVSKGLTAGGGLASAGMALVVGFAFPSPEEIMLQEIAKVKQMIYQLGTDMHGRFDQVDRSLNSIQTTLNDTLAMVNHLEYDIQQTRQGLLAVQMDLHRLERQLFNSFTDQQHVDLQKAINAALYWDYYNPAAAMDYDEYSSNPNYENTFYTYACNLANNDISSPSFSSDDLADANLPKRFSTYPLNANLNFVNAVLGERTPPSAFDPSDATLSNPQEWFVSAYAYLQLALENPLHFRTKGLHLDAIITPGNGVRTLTRKCDA